MQFFSLVYSNALSSVPVSALPQILPIPPLSSYPHLEWCICMEITGAGGGFQGVFPSPFFSFFGGYLFIYLFT